ncbi:MAG: glycosyltransferase family 2 protein [Desulforhopalus sp.]
MNSPTAHATSTQEPLIEIIIPNWNGREMLDHCLSSLQAQTYQHFVVTVVDNGSGDGSVELLREEFPAVKLIRLDNNTGFSYAVNRGIECSTAPWLLLLNNDMEVASDCLENLAHAICSYSDYDFFALKMVNYHDRDIIDGAGDAVFRAGVGYRLGTLEKDSAVFQRDREVFGACAGAALYRRNFFEQVGLFDPDFFAYLEDVDLNMRARRQGRRCMFIASAIVYHIGSATSGAKINELTVRLSTRNNMYVLAKNYPLVMFLRFLPAIAVFQCAWLLFCIKKKKTLAWAKGVAEALSGLLAICRKRNESGDFSEGLDRSSFASLITKAEEQAVTSIMARRTAAGKGNLLLHIYKSIFFPVRAS